MPRRTRPAGDEPVAAPLIEEERAQPAQLSVLPISCIREEIGHNPRTDYGEQSGELAALAQSIRTNGLLSNIVVRRDPDDHSDPCVRFLIVSGHRRFEAARMAGLAHIAVQIRPDCDAADPVALALAENLQRRDLNPLEEAEGYQRLESRGWSQERIGRTVGRSQSHVSRALSLLGLPEGTRTMLREGLLSASHGAELVRLLGTGCADKIDGLAGLCVEYDRSVSATRRAVDEFIGMEEARARRAQAALPVDDEPAPARQYATSHKSPTEAATAPDAPARPADPPTGIRTDYTPEQARQEFAASQAPDPDITSPVQDAIRAKVGGEEGEDASPVDWDMWRMLSGERRAWLDEMGLTPDLAIDRLRALVESGRVMADEPWELLGKIAAHHGRTPEDQLLATLGTRWQAIEAEQGPAPEPIDDRADLTVDDEEEQTDEPIVRTLPRLPMGSQRYVLWHWRRPGDDGPYTHQGPVIVGCGPYTSMTQSCAEGDAATFSKDDWNDDGADTVIAVSHELWVGQQYGEKSISYWHRGEQVEVEKSSDELTITGKAGTK